MEGGMGGEIAQLAHERMTELLSLLARTIQIQYAVSQIHISQKRIVFPAQALGVVLRGSSL